MEDYLKGKHWNWKGIQEDLDRLQSTDFLGSALQHTVYNNISIPQVKGNPSLLLHELTARDRYNGAASTLLETLKNDGGWLLLQAVSGAGKTRAILDVFANSTLI